MAALAMRRFPDTLKGTCMLIAPLKPKLIKIMFKHSVRPPPPKKKKKTPRLHCKDQLVNFVQRNSYCLLWEPYETCTLCAENRVAECESKWHIHLPLGFKGLIKDWKLKRSLPIRFTEQTWFLGAAAVKQKKTVTAVEVKWSWPISYTISERGRTDKSREKPEFEFGTSRIRGRMVTFELYPRRLSSSYSPPWEPEISQGDKTSGSTRGGYF
jgi:hypothetical protein